MTREAFEHAVRAAGGVLGVDDIFVIGSQALHASVEDHLPYEATRSIEVDVGVLDDPEGRKADLIDGSIGEASMFHETFGYYAQGIDRTTAVLPEGWRDRLVRFETPSTNGVVAWCLEPHDLWVSKMVAGRPKDLEFCRAILAHGLVEPDRLRRRVDAVEGLDPTVRDSALSRLEAWREVS